MLYLLLNPLGIPLITSGRSLMTNEMEVSVKHSVTYDLKYYNYNVMVCSSPLKKQKLNIKI